MPDAGCRMSDVGCRIWVETFFACTSFAPRVAGGRALRVKPVGLIAVGIPAANSLSRIFVRIGYRAKPRVLTVCETISIRNRAEWPYGYDSKVGSLDRAARGLQPLVIPSSPSTYAVNDA